MSKNTVTIGDYTLHIGDCLKRLKQMPDESVDCVVTSPPYWGLRTYNKADSKEAKMELGAESTPQDYVFSLVLVFLSFIESSRSQE